MVVFMISREPVDCPIMIVTHIKHFIIPVMLVISCYASTAMGHEADGTAFGN
jgi:hypothetical protein